MPPTSTLVSQLFQQTAGVIKQVADVNTHLVQPFPKVAVFNKGSLGVSADTYHQQKKLSRFFRRLEPKPMEHTQSRHIFFSN
jgi:hypothetical protein